jgi:hypothetical protein
MQMALLTAGGNGAGKYELLQMTLPPGAPPATDVNWRADGSRLGFLDDQRDDAGFRSTANRLSPRKRQRRAWPSHD